MKILYILANYPGYGGIEKVTTWLANALVGKGYDLEILSAFTPFADSKPQDLHPAVQLTFFPDTLNTLSDTNRAFFNSQLFENNNDIVIYQDSYVPTLDVLIDEERFKRRSFHFIVAEHNTPDCHTIETHRYWSSFPGWQPKNILRKLYYPIRLRRNLPHVQQRHQKLLSMADHYVLLSESFRPILQKIIGKNRQRNDKNSFRRVVVIPNPLTIEKDRHPIVKKHQLLFVGRLELDKGIDLLLKIWQQAAPVLTDWELIVLGEGSRRKEIEQSIAQGKLPRFYLKGMQQDMVPYYAEASFLLMTSRFEGWGLVLTEAMCYGCLPIAFNSYTALTDIITDGEDGFIIPPFNIERYTQKLLSLCQQENMAEHRRKAQEKARTFDVNRIALLWSKLFKEKH